MEAVRFDRVVVVVLVSVLLGGWSGYFIGLQAGASWCSERLQEAEVRLAVERRAVDSLGRTKFHAHAARQRAIKELAGE